jgi:hypothetical protein
MTNQEAIDDIRNNILPVVGGKSLLMAIEALKAQEVPSVQPERTDKRTKTHACDCVSRQAAIDAICTEGTRLERNGTTAMVEIKQWCVDILEALPSAQPLIWHKCFEDDPSTFPDDDRMVLMSFSNFPTPEVGWFERDDEGGYWTDGGQETFAEFGFFVDGWWELPQKPKKEGDNKNADGRV